MSFSRRLFIFLVIAVPLGLTIMLGFDIMARVRVNGEGLGLALHHALRDSNWRGITFLLAPFVGLGFISAAASKHSLRYGYFLLLCSVIVLTPLYWSGYVNSQRFLRSSSWTASALAIGLVPFKSLILIPVGLLIGRFLHKFTASDKR